MIKTLPAALYEDDNIHYFNEYSGDTVIYCNKIGILPIYRNVNLDGSNYEKDNPELLSISNFFLDILKLIKRKTLKKELNE